MTEQTEPTGQTEPAGPASAEALLTEPDRADMAPPAAVAATGRRRVTSGRTLWIVAAAVLGVLAVGGVAAMAVSHHRSMEGRGWGYGHHQMDRPGWCGDDGDSGDEGRSDGRGSARCDMSHMAGMPDMMGGMPGTSGAPGMPDQGGTSGAVVPARPGDPNGPVVIEPNTPGGPRTVVWPDGRIVTIPQNPSAAAGAVSTTSTPG